MNIVFMGTPDFAVESLSKIYDNGHEVLAVVSQPDRPSGRGMKLKPTPVKEYAESKNIKVYQPEKVRKNIEFIEILKKMKPDVIVVVAYGQILPEEILNIPKYGCINVHGSLLPKYRGSAPIQWSIINGDKTTGITTMYMDKGMDTGDMILKEEIEISDDDTFGSLYEKLKKLGGKLIIETLEKISEGMAPRTKQPDDFTLAPMIEKETCKIDWNKSAVEIRNLVRGLNPMPVAYTTLDNMNYKIWMCEVLDDSLNDETPGTILYANEKEGLCVATGKGVIGITEIQAPNSKRMFIKDYLRGNKITVGKILL
ncbi:MAG: methionyl-tRNA formyltransferase [Clostridia bacterium]|nr:methionyl-tRNA formyltransferase [Clostridia bacterium]